MRLKDRLNKLEEKERLKKYKCHGVWFNHYENPVLMHGALADVDPIGFFQDVKQYEQFKAEAEAVTSRRIEIFPVRWHGATAEPLPENPRMITGWNADLTEIYTTGENMK